MCAPLIRPSTHPPVRSLPDTAPPSAIPSATPPRRVRAHPLHLSARAFLPRSPFVNLTMALLRLPSCLSRLTSCLSRLTSYRRAAGQGGLTTDSRPECPTDGQGHNPIAEVVNARIVGEHHGLRDGFVQNRIEIA